MNGIIGKPVLMDKLDAEAASKLVSAMIDDNERARKAKKAKKKKKRSKKGKKGGDGGR
jgi:hypothetical protein